MCWSNCYDLPAAPGSAATARRSAAIDLIALASDLSDSDTLWNIELVLSELITNAMQAGSTQISVEVLLHCDRVVLSVTDDAPGWPEPRNAADADSGGRGLAIIAALAHDWGITATPNDQAGTGKTVWSVLPIPDPTNTPAGCRFQNGADQATASR